MELVNILFQRCCTRFRNWNFDSSTNSMRNAITKKGKVTPGKWRAYGYKAPTNLWKEAKTGIRSWMLRLGITPENSSPEIQQQLGLNKDITLMPSKTEGEKLREK